METPLALRVHDRSDSPLVDFLNAPHAVRSTARQVLVLSGHVSGNDDASSVAPPFASELGASLAAARATFDRPFEVVVLDSCPVGALDALIEVAPYTRCVVTMNEPISRENLGRVVDRLGSYRGILGPADIARAFVAAYAPTGPQDACVAVDVEGTSFLRAVESLADASSALTAWVADHPDRRLRLYELLEATAVEDFVDLGEVCRVLRFVEWVPASVIATFEEAVSSFGQPVLSRVSGVEHATATGISLMLPASGRDRRVSSLPSASSGTSSAGLAAISFARPTAWLDVLDALSS